jgi:hypothetical protein
MAVEDNLGKVKINSNAFLMLFQHFSELVQIIPRKDVFINTNLHLAIATIVKQILSGSTQIGLEGSIDLLAIIGESPVSSGLVVASSSGHIASSAVVASSAIVSSSAWIGGEAGVVPSSSAVATGSSVVVVDSLADGVVLHYYSANYEKLRVY